MPLDFRVNHALSSLSNVSLSYYIPSYSALEIKYVTTNNMVIIHVMTRFILILH